MPRYTNAIIASFVAWVALSGCVTQRETPASESVAAATTAQALRVPEHEHWGELRDTQVAFEYVRLFESEPTAPLQIIIHLTGTLSDFGQVRSDTITWVTNPADDTAQYANVSIITRDRDVYDANKTTRTERGYWPVDLDGDKTDDLFVLAWRHCEPFEHATDSQGLWHTRRVPVDEPLELRLITRGHNHNQALAITSDHTLSWQHVRDHPQDHIPHLEAALTQADDLQWQERLQQLLHQLIDASTPGEDLETPERGRP